MSCGRPPRRAKRLVRRLAFWRRPPHAFGEFLWLEPPPDAFVREPRRPRPYAPAGAAALELPPDMV
jgi:hypothetical protein